ncbi:oxidoreductase [Mucilaginibacter ginkgonis]|uniref:SDR family oxidoreductase n=1 Tax=Mucilaginibacter ginkgonis TaxID=2682091 RepID=A0A6I4I1V7_9SPHI|nr:oxidoreductase [Mucilaginibacter ginkgonis]QQL50841.1 SDR family oxidoreductase [Mucilaginibacter ginkgonis]
MFSVKDKVVVVTGGNGLLGQQIVMSLRAEGATVISADIHFNKITENDVVVDITNKDTIEECIASIYSKYGRLDGWVNNAYPRTQDWGNKLEDIAFESWRSNVDMHLNGYFLCCQLVLKAMKQQGFGSLINMSSIYGLVGPDFSVYEGTEMTMPAAYAAIKGGLTNLTRYLASYYGPAQVRVNTVSPGGIFNNQPTEFVAKYESKVPMKRMGSPKDIVAAVHYLLSDEASYVTGHNLIVDGGWSVI